MRSHSNYILIVWSILHTCSVTLCLSFAAGIFAFFQSSLQHPDGLRDVDLVTGTGNLIYHHRLLLYRQGNFHSGEKGAEDSSCLEDHTHIEPSADPPYLLTVRYDCGGFWCPSCHISPAGGAVVLMMNLLGYLLAWQHSAQILPFLTQVDAVCYYSFGPVVKALHQSLLHISGLVGAEVKVAICVCWFLPMYAGVHAGKGECFLASCSILVHVHMHWRQVAMLCCTALCVWHPQGTSRCHSGI